MCPTCPFVQVEVKKAEPRDSKAPGQLGPAQWAPRGILTAANGWTTQPAQGWQQPYGPQGECFCAQSTVQAVCSSIYSLFSPSKGVWVSTAGQPIGGCSASSEKSLYSLCCLWWALVAFVFISFWFCDVLGCSALSDQQTDGTSANKHMISVFHNGWGCWSFARDRW